MNLEKLFTQHNIPFQKADVMSLNKLNALPESVLCYLEYMGKEIRLNITPHESAKTTLYAAADIEMQQNEHCTEYGLLVIGNWLNGDLLTIHQRNGRVGYLFHDDLWEENYDVLEEIYVELPYDIEQFVEKALSGLEYPADGLMAEKFMEERAAEDFIRNRYDAEQIVEYISALSEVPDVLPVEIAQPYLSIEIEGGNQVERLFLLEAAGNFTYFDNLVQSRFQKAFEKEKHDLIYYQFEPAWMEVSRNQVRLCYWGVSVNSEYLAVFRKEDKDWIFD